VYGINDTHFKMYTAEPLVPENGLGEVESSAERFKMFIFQQN
jgi:hypothetical protein